jgi:signal transduction histidine kinase
VGALCLYGEKGKNLPPETLSFLSRLGDLVTISIERASVYEGLKKLDESKTWFLLKASHELKSPLASIQSICQTMLEGYLGDLTDKQRELIERIRLRSSVLQETANDLLVLARLRTRLPGGTRERIRLADAVEEILSFMQHDAERKEIRLALEAGAEPVSVTASKEELRSAIGNLLSNAVKYSPRGSTVTVSLSSTPGGARLSVADQGIGIPVSEREGLFREFFRARKARARRRALYSTESDEWRTLRSHAICSWRSWLRAPWKPKWRDCRTPFFRITVSRPPSPYPRLSRSPFSPSPSARLKSVHSRGAPPRRSP